MPTGTPKAENDSPAGRCRHYTPTLLILKKCELIAQPSTVLMHFLSSKVAIRCSDEVKKNKMSIQQQEGCPHVRSSR